RRLLEAPAHDHAAAGAGPVVARRAVDVVALLASEENIPRHRHRERGREGRVLLPLVEEVVLAQEPARGRALGEIARRAAVGEEVRLPERLVLGLVVHVLAEASGRERRSQQQRAGGAAALNTPHRTPRSGAGRAGTPRWRCGRTSDPWPRCRGST